MRLFITLLVAIAAFVCLYHWAAPPGAGEAGWAESKLLDALYTRRSGDLDALLASGASASAFDPESGDPLLAIATQMRYREAFELLLRHGADVNVRNDRGYTPLMTAVIGGGDDELVERLIASGADVNLQADNGMTALMIAALSDRAPTVERLLRAGARADLRNHFGKSAMDLALSAPCRAHLQAAAAAAVEQPPARPRPLLKNCLAISVDES